jgi:cysteine/O-acetylserine efflux protein
MSFVIVTTFTPGPNNISSASMAVMCGYKKTFNYLIGISSGFFVVMIACAYLYLSKTHSTNSIFE